MIRALALFIALAPAVGLLFVPLLAYAQPAPLQASAPPPDPNTQALGQMIIEAAQREASAKAQLIAAQAHITSLEAAAKPPTPAERPATIVPAQNAGPAPELPKP